ncbi:hypothetical protein FJ366_00745 [Candidatus Dependentiae bacterium]|nr:hypothetical protein [Candidatus Dependentiae bacterium]
MKSFAAFFSEIINKREDMWNTHVFFVYQHMHSVRLQPFIATILKKRYSLRILNALTAEELKREDNENREQLSLFGSSEVLLRPDIVWLVDFLSSPDGSFLNQAQKQAFFKQFYSLLGSSVVYCASLSQKDADLLKSFLGERAHEVEFVKIPDRLSYDDFLLCACLADFSSTIELREVYSLFFELSLDQALVLFDHVGCMSKKTWEKSKDYLFSLAFEGGELRDISEFFWTKNAKRFFAEWSRLASEYSDVFWTSYWSNQLFLAYFYIDRASENPKTTPQGQEHSLAPYFTWKNGWKKYTKTYCVQLHQKLFELDCELKNGSESSAFEFFFNAHFF